MPQLQDIPLIVIAGPTAVGKTDISISIAQQFNGEIINGDSMQFYRQLDIGTGKIKAKEKQNIPHHLFDILNMNETFNASQFQLIATQTIEEIYQRGRIPIIVGGTGLYLEGLLYNLEFGHKESTDVSVRQLLEKEAKQIGEKAIWDQLKQIDPQAAQQIPYQNTRRVLRALEVIKVTGELFSSQDSHKKQRSTFNECLIILDRTRELLYDRINRRVYHMIEEGLEDEAHMLYKASNGQDWQSIKGIGYKEWWPYFAGKVSKTEVISTIQQNSRRYAKRQLTWFRNRMRDTHWVNMDNEVQAELKTIELINQHLQKGD